MHGSPHTPWDELANAAPHKLGAPVLVCRISNRPGSLFRLEWLACDSPQKLSASRVWRPRSLATNKSKLMPSPSHSPHALGENQLLAALPPDEQQRFLALATIKPLKLRDILYRPDSPLEYVYFPRSAVLSTIMVMADGQAAEVAAVGFEGMVGVPAFLGAENSSVQVICQIPGDVVRMPVSAFRDEIHRGGQLQGVVLRYTRYLLDSIARIVACNILHSIEERCARWLLVNRDRAGMDEFPMTHEFLALMLGVRRPSVTIAAGALQGAELISYRHGRMTILNREGLEGASCECYRAMRDEHESLFP